MPDIPKFFTRRRWIVFLGGVPTLLVLAAVLAAAALPMFRFAGPALNQEARAIAAAAVFGGSYFALAIGKIPGLSIDRAGIALTGASLMLAAGVLTPEEAYRAIDLDTIVLLLGVMIVVANLRLSGFFAVVAARCAVFADRPVALLCAVTAASGFFSAFLVNDAICLVLAPLVLDLTQRMGRRPMPYLLAVAMASNAGSVATITGNPQNIMIGSFSEIPYTSFALALTPVALAGMVLTVALTVLLHRAEFAASVRPIPPPARPRANRVPVARALLARALLATGAMVALFFAGQAPAKAAIVVGGCLLLTRRVKTTRIYQEIDWSLLLMFAGLFVIVAGAQRALLTRETIAAVGQMHLDRVPVLAGVSAVLSNLVSNVPAVLVLKPFVEGLANRDTAWLTVAMASTLAGNFTVLGSIANLIVVQKAAARGVAIGFWDYFRVGAPLTVLTLLLGTVWMAR